MREIRALAERLRSGTPPHEALSAFVADHDFPMVDGNVATFFFWDGQPADGVTLLHWVHGLESRQPFHRIPGTDAFFLAMDLPIAGRVEYKLQLERGGQTRWVRDPLNPRLARDPFGANSVLPMPGYPVPGWIEPEPGVRRGAMESFLLRSQAWGDEREVRVYLPAEYKAHRSYSLLVVHDGRDYLEYTGIRTVLDNLIHRHEVKPLVVAFTSGSAARNAEYGANPTQVSFLCDELLPALSERFGVTDDPADRGLMGASFGAVSSLYTAWRRPGVFGRLLLQSGSFVFTDVGHHGRSELWDPVVDFVNDLRRDPGRIRARVFLSCGTFEGLIVYNRSIAPLLRAAGLQVRFVESADGHNWIGWRDRLRDGLSWTFPGHLWMTYE